MKKIFFSILFVLALVSNLWAETDDIVIQNKILEVEKRLEALEDYVEKIQPSLVDFSDNLHQSIKDYTQELENNLNDYSRKLETNINDRLKNIDSKRVVINPYSQLYQRIDTNSGYFLIFVKEVKQIDKGFRLNLQIGNPNYADFKDFKVLLFWGKPRPEGSDVSYDVWRQSLNGAEFTFDGVIKKGAWNSMLVDLVPANPGEINYLEAELEVSSVELKME